MNRITNPRAPRYDVVDAAACLNQYLIEQNMVKILGPQIPQLFQTYQRRQIPTDHLQSALGKVAQRYARAYHGVNLFTDLHLL